MSGFWRGDIDALAFRPEGHQGLCLVHRRAFRALVGREAGAVDCLAWFAARRGAFEAAARDKIVRGGLAPQANFHLNSRDVRRATGTGPGTAPARP